jgi:hypothetical protein
MRHTALVVVVLVAPATVTGESTPRGAREVLERAARYYGRRAPRRG